jgi:branched-chain amino acid transport system substrate-binding protein
MRARSSLGYVLMLLAIGVVACGVGLVPSPAAAQTIKIGFGGPLTGDQSYMGKTYLNGVQLAVDEVNAKGGVLGKKLEVVSLDDQADPKQATTVAQRFCDNREVFAVVAHFNSGCTLPSEPVYNKCRLLQLTTSSNPRVTQLGFDQIFRIDGDDNLQGGMPAIYSSEKLGAKRAAVLHDKQAFGQGTAEVFAKTFQGKGGTVTSVNGITHGDVDFSAVLTKIKTENPDVVYFGGTSSDGGLILKQMRQTGLKAPFMGPDGLFEPTFIEVATAAAAEGSYVTYQAPPFDSTPTLRKFSADYREKFKEEPGPYSPMGYDEVMVIADAMRRAGKLDRDAIVKAARTTKIPGLIPKTIEFNEKGELKDPMEFLYKVKGGKFALEAGS